MAGIRLTKAERGVIDYINERCPDVLEGMPKLAKAWTSFMSKVEASVAPDKGCSLPLKEATAAFREVLGNRLVLPPSGAAGVYAQMTKRLKALGLTRGDCVTVAKSAAAEWRGPIKAVSLLNQADTLLAAAQGELDLGSAPQASRVELDEL